MAKDNQATATAGVDELEVLRAKLAAAEKLNEELMEAAQGKGVSVPIPGEFVTTMTKPDGSEEVVRYRFKPGRVHTALKTGERVPSAGLLRLANGEALTDTDKQYPPLMGLTKDTATAFLAYLVAIGSNVLEKVG